jgi:hypothetical protein
VRVLSEFTVAKIGGVIPYRKRNPAEAGLVACSAGQPFGGRPRTRPV